MRIALVGGGTGGHFYPLIAVAEQLRAIDTEHGTNIDIFYLGPSPYDPKALADLNITHVYAPAGKMRRYRSWRNYTDIFKTMAGVVVAFWKLFWLYPDVVLSKGGFTSVPVIIAAWLLRIPIMIHESDAVPGKANKIAAPLARYIGVAHDDVAPFFPSKKVAQVGMPLRQSFFTPITDPFAVIGVPNNRPIIFVTGGSLGAERLNNLVMNSLDELLPEFTIVHQTGSTDFANVQKTVGNLITNTNLLEHYFAVESLTGEQMAAAYEAAALVISRAGSTTLFEIALKGKPSIIIPIPEDISRDQRSNAYAYARSGAATVMEERNLTEHLLQAEVRRIIGQPAIYSTMQTAAKNFTTNQGAYTLAVALLEIGKAHE